MKLEVVEKDFPGDFVNLERWEGNLIAVYEQGLFQIITEGPTTDNLRLRHICPPVAPIVLAKERREVPRGEWPSKTSTEGR